jgi:hypothetical protein
MAQINSFIWENNMLFVLTKTTGKLVNGHCAAGCRALLLVPQSFARTRQASSGMRHQEQAHPAAT